MRRRLIVALAVVALPATAAVNAHASAPARSAVTMSVPVHGAHVDHFVRNTVISGNWAGWVALPSAAVTGVRSTYTVPTAKLTPPGFSASWTGIGGFNTNDLIQAGTTSDSFGGPFGPRYYAWFEILPASERQLINCSGDSRCTVRPGNRMSIDIHSVGTNRWSVTVVNSGHWSWSAPVSYRSSRSSAEWILEAPSIGGAQTTIAHVGTAYFGTRSTFLSSGVWQTLGSVRHVKVNLAGAEATTSALARNRQSFRVCTYRLTCAAPAS